PGEPLARYTSFRIGGPADLLVLPDTADELAHVLATTAAFGVCLTLLGGGSNVLVGDGGMRGVVVKLGRGFARIDWEAERESAHFGRRGLGRAAEAAREFDRSAARAARAPDGPPDDLNLVPLRAGAAVQLGRLARATVARGLAGLEYAEGIPGTVGGALFMNAGAYGGELAHAVESVEGLGRDGRALELPGRALVFGYRRSALPPGFVVTAVRLRLRRDESGQVRNRLDEARARRTAAPPHRKARSGGRSRSRCRGRSRSGSRSPPGRTCATRPHGIRTSPCARWWSGTTIASPPTRSAPRRASRPARASGRSMRPPRRRASPGTGGSARRACAASCRIGS